MRKQTVTNFVLRPLKEVCTILTRPFGPALPPRLSGIFKDPQDPRRIAKGYFLQFLEYVSCKKFRIP